MRRLQRRNAGMLVLAVGLLLVVPAAVGGCSGTGVYDGGSYGCDWYWYDSCECWLYECPMKPGVAEEMPTEPPPVGHVLEQQPDGSWHAVAERPF